ncbi:MULTISPECIES: hypothetical protein [Protofrankia]|uniref:hypothetical protein n=1 Tax=Protofrankia TaxID=2994361 RepID=UPI0002EA4293|nr:MULTISPECIES: hypothetical protein [Protofrankia]
MGRWCGSCCPPGRECTRFDVYDDTVAIGRELIPLLRQEVARRDRQRIADGEPPLGAAPVGAAGWRAAQAPATA